MLDKKSFVSDGVRQVYSISTSQIATLIGAPLTGSYLQLVDNQPGGLGVIGLPHLDAGPFLSYGIQWITFGVVAPILLGYFVYAEVRARRADKAQATPTCGQAGTRDRRRQAHRPLRTATLTPANTSAAAACTARESRTARRISVTVGGWTVAESRPDLQLVVVLGGAASCTPSAPANAASTTPALGLG